MDKLKIKKVLLLEPNYKNKYPPLGLMKISTYHRMMGDNIIFYKGNVKDLILDLITNNCLNKLKEIDPNIRWYKIKDSIKKYIITHNSKQLNEIIEFTESKNSHYGHYALVELWLKHFSEYYRRKKYIGDIYFDRIYITTLFTFYWELTVKTINEAKVLVKNLDDIKVGGVLATVLSNDLEKETGIKPHKGLLDKPGIFDNNNIIIDELPLDYSILDEIDYKYPERNAYYGYVTRGCIRKCSFCAVWKIEPKFNPYISLKDKINTIKEKYGDQRNLLLLDNNVLASKQFSKIIEEIKKSGFIKGAKFIEPNYLDIAITNLKNSVNDKAYVKKSFDLLQYLLKKLKGQKQQDFYLLLKENDLLNIEGATKDAILKIYPKIKDTFEEYRNKVPKMRYVDFNQGVDARLLTEEKMKLLSEIPIKPLRIAFDSMDYKDIYVNAVRLAAKYDIRNLSNYLLYNEKDKPEDLYERIKINVLLAEELNINIYSFPMKYHPISGEKYLNRDYIGEHWNRKYIRAIQTILNATKGKIGTGVSFFYKAFGKDINEYNKILLMPETYILHRYFFEEIGFTEKWWNGFNNLTTKQQNKALEVIKANDFSNIAKYTKSKVINNFILEHYAINRSEINNPNSSLYKLKKNYDCYRKKNAQLRFSQDITQIKDLKEYILQG